MQAASSEKRVYETRDEGWTVHAVIPPWFTGPIGGFVTAGSLANYTGDTKSGTNFSGGLQKAKHKELNATVDMNDTGTCAAATGVVNPGHLGNDAGWGKWEHGIHGEWAARWTVPSRDLVGRTRRK
ncbi:hypothetical protein PAXRUDRAFT_25871 [Paxillus rubicundulus Ve08.2h10]|uniref:Uncharacterized protein n=1 Tax=Paxillus rubicundulus Ve08.2h10 TaxID=930991 RepID=A0A0D0DBI9_9AGAM|nr:hypothetical protein PAXRUDRAFT_25871 [Paxillus rubicundulus Ve08.2h10]